MDFLVDLDTIKKLSLVHGNVENDVIRKVLLRSQDMYIEPILGSALYQRLLEGVNAEDLTANELTLINDYIIMVLSISVELRLSDAITTEIRNIGTGKATDTNFQANTSNEMERTKDTSYKDLTFYKNRLKRYLCENASLYPLYEASNLYGIKPERTKTNSYSNNFFISKR